MGMNSDVAGLSTLRTEKSVKKTNELLAQILVELRIANSRTAPPEPPAPEPTAKPEKASHRREPKPKPQLAPRAPMTIILGRTPESAAAAHRGFLEAYPGAPVLVVGPPEHEAFTVEPGDVVHVFGYQDVDAAGLAPVRDLIYRSMMSGNDPAACSFERQVAFLA